MNYFYTFLLCLSISLFSFSQVITFECNNAIQVISYEEIQDNIEASSDWNQDGVIDENDYIIYFQEIYNCNTACEEIIDVVVDCAPCAENQTMVFWEELDEENCVLLYMCGCESNMITWNDIDWVLSDWDSFDWTVVWDELDLGNVIDWDNIPWDEIVDFNILPEDLINYIISISGGQPFNWNNFISSQGCVDEDNLVSIGLSVWTDVDGCTEAVDYIYSQNLYCSTPLNLDFVSYDPISLDELCCETCQYLGCTDASACNYDSLATDDDGSCDYGVECFVDPCLNSENPGIDGAYCINDYCNDSCCALWYSLDGELIYNSCDETEECVAELDPDCVYMAVVDPVCGCDGVTYSNSGEAACNNIFEYTDGACGSGGEGSILGLWYNSDSNQYFEITEDVFGVYSFIEDDYYVSNCWYYWAMDYIDLGDGVIEITDYDGEVMTISVNLLASGDLELIVPDDEYGGSYPLILELVDVLPEMDMCWSGGDNEGCEDIYGQWTYENLAYITIDEYGVKIMYPEEDDLSCYQVLFLLYSQYEESDLCQIFIENYGMQFNFGQAFLNADGTLSFIIDEDDSDFPEIWTPDNSDLSGLETCVYGCTDPNACNYDPFANSDNGTCGLIDDCGDCQIPYCYDMMSSTVEYISEEECEGLWVGNNCDEDQICLSNPMNPYWNANCNTLIEENVIINNPTSITNIMGQSVGFDKSGFKLYFYNNGKVKKKYIFR